MTVSDQRASGSAAEDARPDTNDEPDRVQARAGTRGARRADRDGGTAAPAAAQSGAEPSAAEKSDDPAKPDKESGRGIGTQVSDGVTAVRNRIASVVWLIAVLCAVVLAVGALLTALGDNTNDGNPIVAFIHDTARTLDGPFGSIFSFDGKDGRTKEILVNWGLAALTYLVAGRILDRIIRA